MARTCILRAFRLQMSWRFSLVCYVCFVLLRFRPYYAFVEAAALRSIYSPSMYIYIYAGFPIATSVSFVFLFSFLFIWRCRFFRVFFVPLFPLSLCMDYRVRRTFFPSGWCFFLPCNHGLDFLHQLILCENSIKKV